MADIEQTIDLGDPARRQRVIKYYLLLKEAWKEFGTIADDGNYPDGFTDWVQETYGIRPHLDEHGNFAQSYDVIDEPKYTMFLLKYSK